MVKQVLRQERAHREIIALSAQITSFVFKTKARKLFSQKIEKETIKKHHEQISAFKNSLIAAELCTAKKINSLSDLDIYNDIVRPISLRLLRKETKKH